MKRQYSTSNLGCENCGGVMSFFATHCPYCQQLVSWSARMHVLGDAGWLLLIVTGVAAGMLLGWVGYHIPKPNVMTGLSLVVLLWYLHQVVRQSDGSSARTVGTGTA